MQELGTGVQGWVFDALSSPLTVRETPEVLKEMARIPLIRAGQRELPRRPKYDLNRPPAAERYVRCRPYGFPVAMPLHATLPPLWRWLIPR